MQASFAKVENGVVTRIAVVAQEFLEANPERYGDASLWVPMEWGVKGKHGAGMSAHITTRRRHAGLCAGPKEQRIHPWPRYRGQGAISPNSETASCLYYV